ncbi:hypothetical protein J8V57_13600 [Xenorhabdus sp. PB61.4]|uniref:hypothetical protein n=1 Tax=Xenorhabdus sp. PB61.4 TaxID=2788940 RepID=UPI001E3A1524|nr:hypothetical protein [Xenorhabdus sp. PB61.4]MCC8367290.1 hypothetical protein [Xenorhabdus sp. PB61.4]
MTKIMLTPTQHRKIRSRPNDTEPADSLLVPVKFAGNGVGADRGRTARWPQRLRGYVGNGRPAQSCPQSVRAGRPKPTQHNVGELYATHRAASAA